MTDKVKIRTTTTTVKSVILTETDLEALIQKSVAKELGCHPDRVTVQFDIGQGFIREVVASSEETTHGA